MQGAVYSVVDVRSYARLGVLQTFPVIGVGSDVLDCGRTILRTVGCICELSRTRVPVSGKGRLPSYICF
jgi:hypothetical protein